MDLFNIISGVCSIVGLVVSLFTAGKVIKITQNINSGNVNDNSKNVNKVSKSTINGSYVGGNSINEIGNNKQD